MNLHERVGRSNRIKAFMEEGLFNDAAEEIKGDLMNQLLKTDFNEQTEREKLYLMVKAFGELRQRLQMWLNDGLVAEEEIKHLEQVEKDERDEEGYSGLPD